MAEWQKRWNTLVGKLEVVVDATAAQRLLDRLSAPEARPCWASSMPMQ